MGEQKTNVPAGVGYVVQQLRTLTDVQDGSEVAVAAWVDVATVEVPPKSKRGTVIRTAVIQAKLTPEVGGKPLRLRVLDAQAAHVSEVGVEQPPVQLRIA